MKLNKIFKPNQLTDWAVIPTAIFDQTELSLGAIGLYCYLFTRQQPEEISQRAILTHFKCDLSAFESWVGELIQNKFLMPYNALNEAEGYLGNFYLAVPYLDLNKSVYKLSNEVISKDDNKSLEYNLKNTSKTLDYNNNIYNIYNTNKSDNTHKPINTNKSFNNVISVNTNKSKNTNNIPRNVKSFSDGTKKAFVHFEKLFPERNRPHNKAQLEKWLDCLDKIERIDKYDLREVYLMVKKMRQDDFWQNNFLSILKLRNTDKNGVKYIDRFMAQQENHLQSAKNKINGLLKFYKYKTPNGDLCIGAKTKQGDLDQTILAQKLTEQELQKLMQTI